MAEYIESSLYKGKVIIRFYPISHQYWASVNGGQFKRKSGATTYINIKDKSLALGMWQQRITADFLLNKIESGVEINSDLVLEAVVQNDVARDTAADIGKEIHGWIEAYIKHQLGMPGHDDMPPIPNFPEAVQGVNAFMDWEKAHKVKYVSSERVVYSLKHDYMGTLDIEAKVNGKLCLIDIKSANGLYNGVLAQTAAYQKADEEETKKKYHGRYAIRVSKVTEEEYYRQEERKKELKKAICRIRGKEFKDYAVKPYQVFEACFLDDEKGNLKRDFDAFLNMKALCEWDRITSGFNNLD